MNVVKPRQHALRVKLFKMAKKEARLLLMLPQMNPATEQRLPPPTPGPKKVLHPRQILQQLLLFSQKAKPFRLKIYLPIPLNRGCGSSKAEHRQLQPKKIRQSDTTSPGNTESN